MSLVVLWTDEALETFDLTVHSIENKWGVASAEKFVKSANKIINANSLQPFLFKSIISDNTRIAVITKQTSMVYEVHPSHITIHYFWDNRQQPLHD